MNQPSRGAKLALLITIVGVVFLLVFGVGMLYGAERPSLIPPDSTPLPNSESSGEEEQSEAMRVNVLVCGIDDTQQLTDVIMLTCLNFSDNTAQVLQIPRDTFVGWDHPTGKINALYGMYDTPEQGIERLERRVETLTGVSVDYYAAITLNGLRNVVDYMGGIPIDIPYTIEYLPGKTLWPGQQILDGEKAEWFVRYRAGYATGDIGRISAQQLFLEAFMQLVRDRGRIETLKAVSRNYEHIITDISMLKAADLASRAFEIQNEQIQFHLAPGEGVMANGYAVYALDQEALVELLNQYFTAEAPVEADDLDIPQVE